MKLPKELKKRIKAYFRNYLRNKENLENIYEDVVYRRVGGNVGHSSNISDPTYNSVAFIEDKSDRLKYEIKIVENSIARFEGDRIGDLAKEMFYKGNNLHIACQNLHISESYAFWLLRDLYLYASVLMEEFK